MSLTPWFWKLAHWSHKSLFAVFILYWKRVDPEWSLLDTFFMMVVIATCGVNIFKGSLYDFDCVTHNFSWATCLLTIPLEFVLRNHCAQSLHIVEHPNFQTLNHGMQPMKGLRQLHGCNPAAAYKHLRLPKVSPIVKAHSDFKNHVSTSCSVLWLLGSSNEGSKYDCS